MAKECVFCDYRGPSEVMAELDNSYIIDPINPVVQGHRLVVSKAHLRDALHNASLTALTMKDAVRFAQGQGYGRDSLNVNFITSVGTAATQTVEHLHIHIVPRRENDGIHLPWTEQ